MARVAQDALLNVLVTATALLFTCFKLLDSRFRRAVASFEAVYLFRTPSSSRSLVFSNGRITTREDGIGPPDFEVDLLDPKGALRAVLKNPNDLISLIVENKIDQSGNLFFLYKFGYLAGLCEARFARLGDRLGIGSRSDAVLQESDEV